LTSPCPECERTRIALHTAQIEAEHRERVITALKAQVENLEAQVRKGGKKA
jgi:hypothetical protein